MLFNGQDEETDAELQDRYYASLGKVGARRVESIEANVLDEVEGYELQSQLKMTLMLKMQKDARQTVLKRLYLVV